MGTPSNSTVVRTDNLLIEGAGGQPTSERVASLKGDLSGYSTESPTADSAGRPTWNQQYPTEHGRFLDPDHDRAIAFRHTQQGSGGLFQVGTVDDEAHPDWHSADTTITDRSTDFTGMTVVLGTAAGTVTAPAGTSTTVSPLQLTQQPDSGALLTQQWTLLPADSSHQWYAVVSRADGLCMDGVTQTSAGSVVKTYPCQPVGTDDQQLWSPTAFVVSPLDPPAWALQQKASHLDLVPSSNDSELQLQPVPDRFGTIKQIVQPGGVVPTWSTDLSSAHADADDQGAPFDMAAGDLDRVAGTDTKYHDEVAVAYPGADHTLQVRVLDYNANASHLLVSAPSQALNIPIGTGSGDSWMAGSIAVAIGDFDGDSLNELAVTWQDSKGLHAALLRYIANGSSRTLGVAVKDTLLVTASGTPGLNFTPGINDAAAGDFDGNGADDLAVAFAANGPNVGTPIGKVVMTAFDSTLTKPSTSPAYNLNLPGGPDDPNDGYFDEKATYNALALPGTIGWPNANRWTEHGIRLASGLFKVDDGAYNLHRRQLAAAWSNDVDDTSGSGEVAFRTHTGVQIFDAADNQGYHVESVDDAKNITLDGSPGHLATNRDSVLTPLSLTAGGFVGRGDPNSIPAWGLALAVGGRTLSNGDDNNRIVVIDGGLDQKFTSDTVDINDPLTVAAFDQTGTSLALGPPEILTISNIGQPQMIAAQPPGHLDWLDGAFSMVSRNSDTNVQMGSKSTSKFTTTTTTKSSTAKGVSEKGDITATVKEGLPFENFEASVQVGQEMNKQWDTDDVHLESHSSIQTANIQAATGDDDWVIEKTTTTEIFRYPILGGPLLGTDGNPLTTPACPTAPCYGYYEIGVPTVETQESVGSGKNLDWYQPPWQNGNALSYPVVDHPGGVVKITDQGSSTYGSTTTTTPYFNDHLAFGSGTLEVSENIEGGGTTTNDHTSAVSLFNEASLTLGFKTDVGFNSLAGTVEGSVNTKYDETDTTSQLTGGESENSSERSVVVNGVPLAQSQAAYDFATAYYTDSDGVDKVVHAVDFSNQKLGGWWKQHYGAVPDPALNLPSMSEMDKATDGSGKMDLPKWETVDDREKIRGFYPQDAETGAGLGIDPIVLPGDTTRFQVRIANYSLAAAQAVPVRFSAVPVSIGAGPNGTTVTTYGPEQVIGTDKITSPMNPEGATMVTSDAWTAPVTTTLQNWRIFVTIDPDHTTQEIHPLAGTPCPASSLHQDSDDSNSQLTALIDPKTGKPDPNGCGQNNQGFGEVSVSPTAGLESAQHPARLHVRGLTLQTERQYRRNARPKPGKSVSVSVGDHLQGLVHVTANLHTRASQTVLIYDGKPSKDRLVASTHLAGVSSTSGGRAAFEWTPSSTGRHVLYTLIMPTHEDRAPLKKTLIVHVKKAPVRHIRLVQLPELLGYAIMPSATRSLLLTTVTDAITDHEAGNRKALRVDLAQLVTQLHAARHQAGVDKPNAIYLLKQVEHLQDRYRR